ncbi:MAG: amino acid--tRNA ligase-related protein [Oliverpabstia sp.]
MDGKPGDLLLFAADKNKVVWDVLGALRLELAQTAGICLIRMSIDFVWITEFPLLEWSDEEEPLYGDASSIYHADGRGSGIRSIPILVHVRAKAYDIVLNGTELGGGSVRIHQDDIQEKMFEVLGFTKEQRI